MSKTDEGFANGEVFSSAPKYTSNGLHTAVSGHHTLGRPDNQLYDPF